MDNLISVLNLYRGGGGIYAKFPSIKSSLRNINRDAIEVTANKTENRRELIETSTLNSILPMYIEIDWSVGTYLLVQIHDTLRA